MQKQQLKMTETLAELSNEYQHERVLNGFPKYLRPCALDKSTLSIGRVK